MKKICCIVNPVSGLKKSLKVYYEAKNHFEKSNFNTSLFVSEYPNHIKDYVSKIDKNSFDRLIVFGGDGTINEVQMDYKIQIIFIVLSLELFLQVLVIQ